MRILVASPYLPWPLNGGGRVAQYRTFEALRADCTFTLVVPVYSREEEADAQTFGARFPNVTVKAVRLLQVGRPPSTRNFLRRCGGTLLRRCFPTLRWRRPQTALEAIPPYLFGLLSSEYVTAVEAELANGFDVFQAEFAETMTLGPLMAGRIPSIFVHHQLNFVYTRRFLSANPVSGACARYLSERMISEERAYLNAFDSIIVFSEVDSNELRNFSPAIEVSVSPFPSPEDAPPTATLFDRATNRFVFVASESHPPNVDGFRWFMKDVWPIIKSRLPGASIEVIGKWSESAQASLPNCEAIRFVGFVPELLEALRNKIMVVPVWIGSGIRTKILAAWCASCPVVTTTVGVEGLPGEPDAHFVVADVAPAFADACIDLSQNIDKLNRIAANGLELVQELFSLEAVRKSRLDVYEKLLATHRLSKS